MVLVRLFYPLVCLTAVKTLSYGSLALLDSLSRSYNSRRLLEHVHSISHFFTLSYEPDQDSFLFLDALEKEYSFIKQIDPTLIVEMGPGSGIISTFLTRIVSRSVFRFET